MNNVLRTSEFWMTVITALGQLGVVLKYWTQEDYNTILAPSLTYIVARLISKTAKARIPIK